MKKIFLVSVAVSAIILGGCAPAGEGEEVVDEGLEVAEDGTEVTDTTDTTASGGTETITPISVGGSTGPVVYFDFDKYNIKPEMQAVVNAGANLAKGQAGNVQLSVEGHCDEWGTDEYNQALGLRRANSVKRALTKLGLTSGQISVKSFGESKPVCTQRTKECDAKNRRAEIKVGL